MLDKLLVASISCVMVFVSLLTAIEVYGSLHNARVSGSLSSVSHVFEWRIGQKNERGVSPSLPTGKLRPGGTMYHVLSGCEAMGVM